MKIVTAYKDIQFNVPSSTLQQLKYRKYTIKTGIKTQKNLAKKAWFQNGFLITPSIQLHPGHS